MNVFWVRLLPLVLTALMVAACGSTVKKEEAGGADVSDYSAEGAGMDGAMTSGAAAGGAWTGSALDNPDSPLYTKVIYFDFDSAEIRPDYASSLRAHADYLAANPSITVTLEGHGDERGTREYNMGLGERRANAVRSFLNAEGIADAQIRTISYGEEQPADPGHSEAAWAMNRRVVLVY